MSRRSRDARRRRDRDRKRKGGAANLGEIDNRSRRRNRPKQRIELVSMVHNRISSHASVFSRIETDSPPSIHNRIEKEKFRSIFNKIEISPEVSEKLDLRNRISSGSEQSWNRISSVGEQSWNRISSVGEQSRNRISSGGEQSRTGISGSGEEFMTGITGSGEQFMTGISGSGEQFMTGISGDGEQFMNRISHDGEQFMNRISKGEEFRKRISGGSKQPTSRIPCCGEQSTNKISSGGRQSIRNKSDVSININVASNSNDSKRVPFNKKNNTCSKGIYYDHDANLESDYVGYRKYIPESSLQSINTVAKKPKYDDYSEIIYIPVEQYPFFPFIEVLDSIECPLQFNLTIHYQHLENEVSTYKNYNTRHRHGNQGHMDNPSVVIYGTRNDQVIEFADMVKKKLAYEIMKKYQLMSSLSFTSKIIRNLKIEKQENVLLAKMLTVDPLEIWNNKFFLGRITETTPAKNDFLAELIDYRRIQKNNSLLQDVISLDNDFFGSYSNKGVGKESSNNLSKPKKTDHSFDIQDHENNSAQTLMKKKTGLSFNIVDKERTAKSYRPLNTNKTHPSSDMVEDYTIQSSRPLNINKNNPSSDMVEDNIIQSSRPLNINKNNPSSDIVEDHATKLSSPLNTNASRNSSDIMIDENDSTIESKPLITNRIKQSSVKKRVKDDSKPLNVQELSQNCSIKKSTSKPKTRNTLTLFTMKLRRRT